MGLDLFKKIKNNISAFIILKSNFNPKRASKNLKIFQRIKDLDLIDDNSYLSIHKDCEKENLNPVAHYLFYGQYDSLDDKKHYINGLFDLNFYKNSYLEDLDTDPIIDYVWRGFFKGNLINPFDEGYIKNISTSLNKQINIKINSEIANNYYITDKKILIPYIQSKTTFKTDTIKVGVFINDPFENLAPCPYIRVHAPFKRLSKTGKFNFFMYGMDSYQFMDYDKILNSKVFDIVVVQRILPFLDIFLEKCLKNNIKIIYETDDDLLAVEENSPSFEYVDRCRDEIANLINSSDIVTVTTPELAKRFNDKKVEIIRNYYVEDVFPMKTEVKKEGKIKIGYFGTLTHSKDLFLIKDAIIKLKERKNLDFDFEIIGGFNELDNIDEDWYRSIDLPSNSMDFEKFMSWLSTMAKWDIGIAPLENSYFNNGKSELKYIEFTALGVPGVYSNMKVYNSVIKDGFNGFLAKNEDEWIEKLEKLILNKDLRKNILKNARNDVLENYSLDDRVKQWENILTKI